MQKGRACLDYITVGRGPAGSLVRPPSPSPKIAAQIAQRPKGSGAARVVIANADHRASDSDSSLTIYHKILL